MRAAAGIGDRAAGLPEAAAEAERELFAAESEAIRLMLDPDARSAEGREELRRLCSLAFGLRRALPAPREPEGRLEFAAVLACEGILGGRIEEARRWLGDAAPDVLGSGGPPAGAAWNAMLLSGIIEAFLEAVAAEDQAGLRAARDRIRRLRESQPQFEPAYLEQRNGIRQAAALELVACYHMAKAVETLGASMGAADPRGASDEVGFHAARALRAARDAGSAGLSTLFLWIGNAMKALLASREAQPRRPGPPEPARPRAGARRFSGLGPARFSGLEPQKSAFPASNRRRFPVSNRTVSVLRFQTGNGSRFRTGKA